MAARLGNFIIFLILSIITLGIYPLYFFVTRQQENTFTYSDTLDWLCNSWFWEFRRYYCQYSNFVQQNSQFKCR